MRVLILGSATAKGRAIVSKTKIANGTGWVENLVDSLSENTDVQLYVACFSSGTKNVLMEKIDDVHYIVLPTDRKRLDKCTPLMINSMVEISKRVNPDVVHIIGTEREYDYRLAEICGFQKVVVSITGLVSVCAHHYFGGIEKQHFLLPSFGDIYRHGGPIKEQKQFVEWGKTEVSLIKSVKQIFGRTTWDYACIRQINPNAKYHWCSEILNPVYFNSTWDLKRAKRHSIFCSQASYPLKGFHQVLKAFKLIIERFPDAELVVAGYNLIKKDSIVDSLKITTYGRYILKLIRRLGIPRSNIHFIGMLTPEEMARQYLLCNVFVSPSAIENSPNSLGEAMMLGVPCVASCVGGVQDMLRDRVDGFIYPFDEFYMLAHYVCEIFKDDKKAEAFGNAARSSAMARFNPERVVSTTVETYKEIVEHSKTVF